MSRPINSGTPARRGFYQTVLTKVSRERLNYICRKDSSNNVCLRLISKISIVDKGKYELYYDYNRLCVQRIVGM